jgi:DDE superfamily endonuclease
VFLGGEATPRLACDFVISVDEKISVQARRRKQPTLPAAADRPMRVEHEYFREGAWTYLAAWDVHRAKLFGRCEKKSGIAPTDRLMSEVMSQEPYKSAHRVFCIMDNCSAHRGERAMQRIRSRWPNAILVPTPIHASWLNQIEIYFSIVLEGAHSQRFLIAHPSRAGLVDFPMRYEQTAAPFRWTFTRDVLSALLAKLHPQATAAAA